MNLVILMSIDAFEDDRKICITILSSASYFTHATCSYGRNSLPSWTSKSILSTNLHIKPVQEGGTQLLHASGTLAYARTPEKSPLGEIIRARWQKQHYSYNGGEFRSWQYPCAWIDWGELYEICTSGTRTLLSQIRVTWKNICLIEAGSSQSRFLSLSRFPVCRVIFHRDKRALAVRENIWL